MLFLQQGSGQWGLHHCRQRGHRTAFCLPSMHQALAGTDFCVRMAQPSGSFLHSMKDFSQKNRKLSSEPVASWLHVICLSFCIFFSVSFLSLSRKIISMLIQLAVILTLTFPNLPLQIQELCLTSLKVTLNCSLVRIPELYPSLLLLMRL